MIIIAESSHDHYPFSVLHCQWELRTGFYRIFERNIKALRENNIAFFGRTLHLSSFFARFPNYAHTTDITLPVHNDIYTPNTIILRGDTFYNNDTLECFRRAHREAASTILFTDFSGDPIALILPPHVIAQSSIESSMLFEELVQKFASTIERTIDIEAKILIHLWDVFDICSQAIIEDEILGGMWSQYKGEPEQGIYVKGRVFTGKECSIGANTVFDASAGVILIGDNVTIMPNSTIIGPCSIGSNSLVKIGAKIYSGTAIGEMCKVGGEIENSVLQGFCNKQHEGFLGHSFISEWVNLGADTNTSDLKNTYGTIDITIRGKKVSTGRMFLGSLIGDHSKTAIDTALNTGLSIGIHAQIATTGAVRKEIHSYSFVTPNGTAIFNNEKAKGIAEIVMKRRKRTLLEEEVRLMDKEFSLNKNNNE